MLQPGLPYLRWPIAPFAGRGRAQGAASNPRAQPSARGVHRNPRGQILTILAARPAPDYPRALASGEAAVVGEHAVIRTADGAIALVRGEIEGSVLDEGGLASLVARGANLVIGHGARPGGAHVRSCLGREIGSE